MKQLQLASQCEFALACIGISFAHKERFWASSITSSHGPRQWASAGIRGLTWSRPWLGVVGLALVGAMHAQSYDDEWMSRFPKCKVQFLVTCVGAGKLYATPTS